MYISLFILYLQSFQGGQASYMKGDTLLKSLKSGGEGMCPLASVSILMPIAVAWHGGECHSGHQDTSSLLPPKIFL